MSETTTTTITQQGVKITIIKTGDVTIVRVSPLGTKSRISEYGNDGIETVKIVMKP